jgi:hypothetical protein
MCAQERDRRYGGIWGGRQEVVEARKIVVAVEVSKATFVCFRGRQCDRNISATTTVSFSYHDDEIVLL